MFSILCFLYADIHIHGFFNFSVQPYNICGGEGVFLTSNRVCKCRSLPELCFQRLRVLAFFQYVFSAFITSSVLAIKMTSLL